MVDLLVTMITQVRFETNASDMIMFVYSSGIGPKTKFYKDKEDRLIMYAIM